MREVDIQTPRYDLGNYKQELNKTTDLIDQFHKLANKQIDIYKTESKNQEAINDLRVSGIKEANDALESSINSLHKLQLEAYDSEYAAKLSQIREINEETKKATKDLEKQQDLKEAAFRTYVEKAAKLHHMSYDEYYATRSEKAKKELHKHFDERFKKEKKYTDLQNALQAELAAQQEARQVKSADRLIFEAHQEALKLQRERQEDELNFIREKQLAEDEEYQKSLERKAKIEEKLKDRELVKKKREARDAENQGNNKISKDLKDSIMGKFDPNKSFGNNIKDKLEDLKSLAGHRVSFDQSYLDTPFAQNHGKLVGAVRGLAKVAGGLLTGVEMLGEYSKKLEPMMDDIAGKRSAVDTALQGSRRDTSRSTDKLKYKIKDLFGSKDPGSYWEYLLDMGTKIGNASPYFKQQDFFANVEKLVNSGIAFDIEQRAFLATISDKIANTFNVFDSNLLKLIRIQQADTTAGRLGMESALTAFLNNMYESSEYLKGVADQVSNSLYELSALSDASEAVELEAQVQKWLGSLYSVGMSEGAVQGIASTFGQIASGQIEGLTGGGFGNLMVMAANRAGLPISSMLTSGLNAGETNLLLESMTGYLAEIANSTSDNRVVQQQIAKVFGLNASDLKAVTNLVTPDTIKSINMFNLTYGDMMYRFETMANSMGLRMSKPEQFANIANNIKYSQASSIANSQTLLSIFKAGNLLDSIGGGTLPTISVMGNSINLGDSFSNLLRGSALAGGIFDSLGSMIQGMANNLTGNGVSPILRTLGLIDGGTITNKQYVINEVSRGNGNFGMQTSGASVSSSGAIGGGSGQDIKDTTLAGEYDKEKIKHTKAMEDEPTDIQNKVLNESILKIYSLLQEVASGTMSLSVRTNGNSTGGWTPGAYTGAGIH